MYFMASWIPDTLQSAWHTIYAEYILLNELMHEKNGTDSSVCN